MPSTARLPLNGWYAFFDPSFDCVQMEHKNDPSLEEFRLDGRFDRDLQRLEFDGNWAGRPSVFALAHALGVSIEVYLSSTQNHVHKLLAVGPEHSRKIRLGFVGDNHWELLLPQDELDSFLLRDRALGPNSYCISS